jgi:1-acyl-sn-glycerol-3-phosphate acyltransferase
MNELPPHLRVDVPAFESYMRTFGAARFIPARVHDAERLPAGPALLVGNHGPFAIDTSVLIHALYRETGRIARGLGDRMVFKNPVTGYLAKVVGGVEGSPENAQALLSASELVLVYPGGARETLREPEQRYQLSWEGRMGFVRVALRAQVPIVPIACVGVDDLLVQVVSREQVLSSPVGKLAAALLGEKYVPPLFAPRMRPTQFHYYVGEPIAPNGSAEDAGNKQLVEAQQLRVKAALEALIQHGRDVRRQKLGDRAEP